MEITESSIDRICRMARERQEYIVCHSTEFSDNQVQDAALAIYHRERLQVRDILRYS